MRIVPRQQHWDTDEVGYGFLFEGRIMRWGTFLEARVAAYILHVHLCEIVPVRTLPYRSSDIWS